VWECLRDNLFREKRKVGGVNINSVPASKFHYWVMAKITGKLILLVVHTWGKKG